MTNRSNTMNKTQDNPYLIMPLPQVKADAGAGVALARVAWRSRDPQGAALDLGRVIEPGHEREQADRRTVNRDRR